jgi:hypothetical protein
VGVARPTSLKKVVEHLPIKQLIQEEMRGAKVTHVSLHNENLSFIVNSKVEAHHFKEVAA